jgi:hypothetical protein
MRTFLLASIGVVLYGFFDYNGFNLITPTLIYRIIQALFFIILSAWLYWCGGIVATTAFLILHQTFLVDFFYYLLYDLLKWYGGESAGTAFRRDVLGNLVTWASWTPYGLIFRLIPGKKSIPISGAVLIWQAVIGFIVAVAFSFWLSQ